MAEKAPIKLEIAESIEVLAEGAKGRTVDYEFFCVSGDNQEYALKAVNSIASQAYAADQRHLLEASMYCERDVHIGMYLLLCYAEDRLMSGFCLFSVMQGDVIYLANIYFLEQYRRNTLTVVLEVIRTEFRKLGFPRMLTMIAERADKQHKLLMDAGGIRVGEIYGKNGKYLLFEISLS